MRCPLPESGRQSYVARAHGQAVGFADGRAHDQLYRQLEAADHILNDRKLLIIFLPHIQAVRLDDSKEPFDNIGNSGEVARPEFSFHHLVELAKIDFPFLVLSDVEVVQYGGDRIRGYWGLEFNAEARLIPETYECVDVLEPTF